MSAQALAALDYARRGWPVFPCHAPAGPGCSCGRADCQSPAKHPRTRHGLLDASTDEAVVRRWWRRWPAANVGLRTGAGLVVVDIDPAHGGTESMRALVEIHGPLPATAAVRTGGGGWHLYFTHDGPLRNSAGALGPGLDVRADGGYVLAPPSWHLAGAPYRWRKECTPAPLPSWVLERLARPEAPRPAPVAVAPDLGARMSAWAAAAASAEAHGVAAAPVGQRNHALNRAAFRLGQIVGGGHIDAGEAAEVLRRAGEAAGLGAVEVDATLASGLDAGRHWPRHPQGRPDHRRPARDSGAGSPAPRPGRHQAGRGGRDAPSLAGFVGECAERLWRIDGEEARCWLTGSRRLPERVLAANRVGADPGTAAQARPAGMASAGPAVVLPVLVEGEATFAQLCPLASPGAVIEPAAGAAEAPPLALLRPAGAHARPVVVTAGILNALAACAAGYRAAALLDGDAERTPRAALHLARLGSPIVVALGGGGGAGADALRDGLASQGVRAAWLHLPSGIDALGDWLVHSRDFPRALHSAVRTTLACGAPPRRLAR